MNAILAFTGHRPHKLGGYDAITQGKLLALAIEFLRPRRDSIAWCNVGMALGWDQAVARACVELDIHFNACVPFEGQESHWPATSQKEYHRLLGEATIIVNVCEPGYAVWKMQKRNEYMVDNAHALVSLWDGTSGGTANCVRYAESKGKRVRNLWLEWNGGAR